MAKAGEFKNKITKAQEELFKALENEQTKRNSTSSKIIQELSKAMSEPPTLLGKASPMPIFPS